MQRKEDRENEGQLACVDGPLLASVTSVLSGGCNEMRHLIRSTEAQRPNMAVECARGVQRQGEPSQLCCSFPRASCCCPGMVTIQEIRNVRSVHKCQGFKFRLLSPFVCPSVKVDWGPPEVPGHYRGGCWRPDDSDRLLTLREGRGGWGCGAKPRVPGCWE